MVAKCWLFRSWFVFFHRLVRFNSSSLADLVLYPGNNDGCTSRANPIHQLGFVVYVPDKSPLGNALLAVPSSTKEGGNAVLVTRYKALF